MHGPAIAISSARRVWRAGAARRRAALGLCAVVAGAALLGCSGEPPAQEAVRAVRVLDTRLESSGERAEYAAEIRARTESRLGFRVGGKLQSRAVDVGDAVRPGQVLAALDPQDLRLGQEAARAALSAAQVQRDQAEADFRRFQSLNAQGFISAAELERRESELKAARAQAEQAMAQATVQGNQAAYARLVADAAGIVTAVEAEPGAVVAAGTPVVRVARDGPRDAVFSVPEDQINPFRALVGRAGAIGVRPWGEGAEAVPATVREVAAAADPTTRTFLVKADLGGAPFQLGQTATVIVQGAPGPMAIHLPLTAVVNSGGRTSVWLLDKASMTVKTQAVQLAGADGNRVIVASGLQPGQTVVTAGVHVLTPGQKVRVYGQAAAAAASAASR